MSEEGTREPIEKLINNEKTCTRSSMRNDYRRN